MTPDVFWKASGFCENMFKPPPSPPGAAVPEVMAPRGNLDAGKDKLFVPLLRQFLRLNSGIGPGQGADRPAGIGDDAVNDSEEDLIFFAVIPEHGA